MRSARAPSAWLIAAAAAGARRSCGASSPRPSRWPSSHGPEAVEEALRRRRRRRPFGDGDLAAILAHHQGAQVIAFPARASEAALAAALHALLGGLRRDDGQDPARAAAARRARPAAAPAADALRPQGRAGGDRDRDRAALGTRRGPAGPARRGGRRPRPGDDPDAPPRSPGCRPARPSTPGTRTPRRSRQPPSTRSARWSGSTAPRPCASAARAAPARATSSRRSGTSRSTTARPSPGTRSRRLAVMLRRHRADDSVDQRDRAADPRRPDRHRRHRHAPGRRPTPPKRCSASSTPPTRSARSRSPATSTPPASTSSCPRPSPPRPSTGCCTTRTS